MEQKPGMLRLMKRTDKEPPGEGSKLRNGMKRMLVMLLAACMLLACTAAVAETMHREVENDALDMEVTVGFGGRMIYGKTMPVRVLIRNFGEDFEGVLGVNAYISTKEYDRFEKEVFVPAGSEREFEVDVSVYARQKTFTAELVKDGEVVCAVNGKPAATVNPSALLIGVLSTRAQSLKNLNITLDNDVLGRFEQWETIPLTQDTFPEDADVMNSFGLLVVDDVDPASLSQKQQDLLDSWLRSGRILICGGGATAARNAAYFGKYTGLQMEEVTSSSTVLENLEQLLDRSVSGNKPVCALAKYSGGEEPLAKDTESGCGLVWRTVVGAGRIYTAAFETGDARLNSEFLMSFFWQQLLVNEDPSLYSTLMYNNSDNYNSATVNAGYSTQVEAKSYLLAGLLIVLGVLVVSCVLWTVLKKKDKRQWMWLTLPVIAVIAAVSILLVSTGAETNRPLAVVADNLVQDSTGTIRNYSGISVAAPEFGRHGYSVAGTTLHIQNYDYVDYDDEEDEKKREEPDTLRTCYRAGGENSVTAESVTPWQMINLSACSPARIQGQITGSLWMEEDGLHGEVVNETDTRFGAGWIMTTYGYVSVPALAPGEKADFMMTRQSMDPQNQVYEDGGLYPDHPNLYSVINDAAGYNRPESSLSAQQKRDRELISSMVNGAADVLRQGGKWSYSGYESAIFLFAAKPENVQGSELKVDGEPVMQQTSLTMLTAELPFSAVGRTGVVFRSVGMDVPERVETDEQKLPTDELVQNTRQQYYHSLTETPTFRFVLKDMDGVKVDKMQVVIDSYYANMTKVYALNAEDRQWKEISVNTDISDPGRFIDKDGKLYIQFRKDTQDMYADIPTPMISLEGRVEHAED